MHCSDILGISQPYLTLHLKNQVQDNIQTLLKTVGLKPKITVALALLTNYRLMFTDFLTLNRLQEFSKYHSGS
jgi:hypothetical protein